MRTPPLPCVPAAMIALLLAGGLRAQERPQLPLRVDMSGRNPRDLPGPHPVTRERLCLNGEWDFYPILDRGGLHGPALEGPPPVPAKTDWKRFRVPAKWRRVSGTWAATEHGTPEEWCRANCAWYQRSFTVPSAMRGKRIKLSFGGVLVYCEVFVNDRSVGKHYCGVTPFSLDVTDAVAMDRPNTLRVYVVNWDVHSINKPKSRYAFTCRAPDHYAYSQGSAGIWQDVYLLGEPALTVDDAWVRTSVRKREIAVDVTLARTGGRVTRVEVAPIVTDLDGAVAKRFQPRTVEIAAGSETVVSFTESWPDARLWCREDPHLYRLHTRVHATGKLLDEHYQRFGFREFWIEGRDFFLNGNRVTLLGDWVGVRPSGTDAYLRPEYLRAYFTALKDAGYRGPRVQLSTPVALDVCDEIGLIQIATGISDGPRFFDPEYVEEAMGHALEETRAWIKRDRNHPCIVAWSTENEDGYPNDEAVRERYRAIDRVFMVMDPTRPFMHDGNGRDGRDSGDFGGFAPVKNFHYGGGSLERQIHAFEEWSRTDTKPRIQGEISNYALEPSRFSHLFRTMGDRFFGDLENRYREADRVIRLQAGGWRSYGLSGFMLFSNRISIMNAPLNATFPGPMQKPVVEFVWDALDTPYPKPTYIGRSNLDFLNPWTDAAPERIPTPMFDSIRHVFSPVLVSLARSTEHTYWGGKQATKDVYVINESTGALEGTTIRWVLQAASGEEIGAGSTPCDLRQGEIRPLAVSLELPRVASRTELRFQACLTTTDGQVLSEDSQELSVYPGPAGVPRSDTGLYLYDAPGRTEAVLRQLGARYPKVTAAGLAALPTDAGLIVGRHAADADLIAATGTLTAFVESGGRVLVLAQDMHGGRSRSVAFVRAPLHPVLAGLPKERLMFWRSESREIASHPIVTRSALRQRVLVEMMDDPDGEVYTRYVPALVECRAGRGRVILCALNVTEGCEKGDPEAIILMHNLLRQAARRAAEPRPRVGVVGGAEELSFFTDTLMVDNMEHVRGDGWTEGLAAGDVLVLAGGVPADGSQADKAAMVEFVRAGGTVLAAGVETEGDHNWAPFPLRTRKLPSLAAPTTSYATGVFHLWKRSDQAILDGLGDLFRFETRRARNYYIGDAIPGLSHGFVTPEAPWRVGYEIAVRATASYKGLRRRAHYESEGDAALVTLRHGRGRYVLCAVAPEKNDMATRLYGALLTNLDVPASHTQPFLAFSRLKANTTLRPAGRKDWYGYTPIDLVPYANRTFMDRTAGDGLGGWDDTGPNDMRNLPTGDPMLGVPFHIIDREQDDPNGDRGIKLGHPIGSCIVLKGEARPSFASKVEGIMVGCTARKLHFLHTATWCRWKEGEQLARYILHYEDGSDHEIPLRAGRELGDWTRAGRTGLKNAQVAWRGSNPEHPNVGLFRLSVLNPHRDRVIKTIDFVSDGKAIPVLVAVTVQR